MKKWFLFLFIVVFVTIINSSKVEADSNYKAYESITIINGKFLSDYSKSDYKKYYKEVDKRKFGGWRINKVTEDAKVTYKTETLFSYYNDGTTSIDYNYEVKKKDTTAFNLSATGSIGVKVSGKIGVFTGGLDKTLKYSADYSKKTEVQENFTVKLKIDPQTMLNLYITGEGKISNGVAAKYLLYMRTHRGGYEIFVITTQYYRLEKVQI